MLEQKENIGLKLINDFREQVLAIDSMGSEFFYNDASDMARDIFYRLTILKKVSKNQTKKSSLVKKSDFKHYVKNAIILVEELINNEYVYEINKPVLNKIKEKLEVILVSVEFL